MKDVSFTLFCWVFYHTLPRYFCVTVLVGVARGRGLLECTIRITKQDREPKLW